MTGRDLIVYILTNHLEDELVFKDGKFIGFISVAEAAERMDVGVATVFALAEQNRMPIMWFENTVYIPADFKSPMRNN